MLRRIHVSCMLQVRQIQELVNMPTSIQCSCSLQKMGRRLRTSKSSWIQPILPASLQSLRFLRQRVEYFGSGWVVNSIIVM
jgi:hypothetical protein